MGEDGAVAAGAEVVPAAASPLLAHIHALCHGEGLQLPRKRHIPERTCVACGGKRPKAELVRIARSPQGPVSVDFAGKAPGRGAYVCGPGCLETALGRGRLARSLGQSLSTTDLETLRLDFSARSAQE